ncbi:MAG: ABC transporter permease, partial [Alphaproteobacteria bacterium]|nr:ABC transporter permease [Alphaproteobacteria bacterium]
MTAPAAVSQPLGRRRVLGLSVSVVTHHRLLRFAANRRGFWSLWIFLAVFVFSLFAEFIASDRPLIVSYAGHWYFPVLSDYTEETFGGDLPILADYRDKTVAARIDAHGWMLWPLIPFGDDTINFNLGRPAPSPPSSVDWLGTDDQGRDVLARLIYGFRISVLFGLCLTIVSSAVGIAAGAVQGYFGGWTDLLFQRFIEIWTSIPELYLLLIISSVLVPGFFVLL